MLEGEDPDSSTVLLQNGSKQPGIYQKQNNMVASKDKYSAEDFERLQWQLWKLRRFFYGLAAVVILGVTILIIIIALLYWKLSHDLTTHTHRPKVTEQMAKILDIEPICVACDDIRLGPSPQEDKMLDSLVRRAGEVEKCCAETPNQLMKMLNMTIERRYREEIARALQGPCVNGLLGNIKMPLSRTSYPSEDTGRPVAHLMGSNMKHDQQGIPGNVFPVEEWIHNIDLAFTQNIRYRHGRLVVPNSGMYFVYSQISFFELYDAKTAEGRHRLETMESPSLSHYLYRYNIIYREGGEELLAQNSVTKCRDLRRSFGEYSSYLGAAFYLRQGDEVFVKVSNLTLISTEPKLSNFGLFKL